MELNRSIHQYVKYNDKNTINTVKLGPTVMKLTDSITNQDEYRQW